MKKWVGFVLVLFIFATNAVYGSGFFGGGGAGGGGGPDATSIARDGSRAATSDIPWGSNKLTGLALCTAVDDACPKSYIDGLITAETDPLSLHLNGDNVPTNDIDMDGNEITGLPAPSGSTSAVNKNYVDTTFISSETDPDSIHLDGSNTPTANIPMGTNRITGLGEPLASQDGATKNYVDLEVTDLELADDALVARNGTQNPTSAINFVAGTVGAPGVSISTSSNGLYAPLANQVAITTAGVRGLLVTATQDVLVENGNLEITGGDNLILRSSGGPDFQINADSAEGGVVLEGLTSGSGSYHVIKTAPNDGANDVQMFIQSDKSGSENVTLGWDYNAFSAPASMWIGSQQSNGGGAPAPPFLFIHRDPGGPYPGTTIMRIDDTDSLEMVGNIEIADGTAALPAISFGTDLSTGIYNLGGKLAFSDSGSLVGNFDTGGILMIKAAGPSYGFVGDEDSGLDSLGDNTIALMTGNTNALFVDTNQDVTIGAGSLNVTSDWINSGTHLRVNNTQVVGARAVGWSVSTGTATRTAFDTSTVTTSQLAERVKALIDDMHATAGHGLIGN